MIACSTIPTIRSRCGWSSIAWRRALTCWPTINNGHLRFGTSFCGATRSKNMWPCCAGWPRRPRRLSGRAIRCTGAGGDDPNALVQHGGADDRAGWAQLFDRQPDVRLKKRIVRTLIEEVVSARTHCCPGSRSPAERKQVAFATIRKRRPHMRSVSVRTRSARDLAKCRSACACGLLFSKRVRYPPCRRYFEREGKGASFIEW
jgi:hypothetical protein